MAQWLRGWRRNMWTLKRAKQAGRASFGEMVAYLKAHPAGRVLLVEKTDRLYRNLKDLVAIDELDAEIHFPKEGVVLSRESRSSEKFMHGIKEADGEELHRQPLGGSTEVASRKRPSQPASGRPRRPLAT